MTDGIGLRNPIIPIEKFRRYFFLTINRKGPRGGLFDFQVFRVIMGILKDRPG
jgi:hypothetical protein